MKAKWRWLMLILLSCCVAIAAILCITFYANSGDPRSINRPFAVHDTVFPILNIGILLGIVGFIIVIIKFAVKGAIRDTGDSTAVRKNSAPNPPGFPIAATSSGIPIPPDGPGQYRIQGVHRETNSDISKYLQ